jgi:GT2 family glycosyltransferase
LSSVIINNELYLANKNAKVVTVAVINYNGAPIVGLCLESILKCSYPNLRVIVIDNASTDSSLNILEKIAKKDSRVKIIKNKKNIQYAKACNLALITSNSEYVAILNSDTVVEPNWLEPIIELFQKDRSVCVCQPKIRIFRYNNDKIIKTRILDSAGVFLSRIGFLVARGNQEVDMGQYNTLSEVFSVKGAAMVLDRYKVLKIGGFDEDFIAWNEEADLCWRVWLSGYKVAYVPASLVYHFGSFSYKSGGLEARRSWLRLGVKNYIAMWMKNLQLKSVSVMISGIIILLIGSLLMLFKDRGSGIAMFSGIVDIFRDMKKILSKRSIIQKNRKISDNEIFQRFATTKNLREFIVALKKL